MLGDIIADSRATSPGTRNVLLAARLTGHSLGGATASSSSPLRSP
jgi:hypothetical protein